MQQQTGKNVDFLIQSGKQSLGVHSALVRFSSPFLRMLLESSCFCNVPGALILDSSYSSVIHSLISLMYTGSAKKLTDQKLSSLLEMLKELGFECLPTVERHEQSNTEAPDNSITDINREVLPLKTKTSIMDPNMKNSFELVFPQS